MRIIAIGGGEIGREGTSIETRAIDEHIVSCVDSRSPRVLFIPTASGDAPGYIETFTRYYGSNLGCRVDSLTVESDDALSLIENADIIYVGGGSTRRLLEVWREYGWDALIERAAKRGTILSGLSAGANCWYESCSTDSDLIEGTGTRLVRLPALGWLEGLFCPHFDAEPARRATIGSMLNDGEYALCADNCAALEYDGDRVRVLRAHPNAHVSIVRNERGSVLEKQISDGWHTVGSLL